MLNINRFEIINLKNLDYVSDKNEINYKILIIMKTISIIIKNRIS